MEARNILLIKKGDVVKNTYTEWNIACCNVPFKTGGKTKALSVRDWKDEHGEDAYIPAKLMFEPYDMEFEMAYVGKEVATNPFDCSLALEKIDAFKKWLTGSDDLTNHPNGTGASLTIYSPYTTIGRQGCYLLEVSDEEPHVQLKQEATNMYNENVITFKLTFRVTDPTTNVTIQTPST